MKKISINDADYSLDEIREALKVEGYSVICGLADHLSNLPSCELKDLFCDMAGVNHHTPKEELIKLLSEKI
jgi:hypothetical protein